MNPRSAATTYIIPEAYEKGLKKIREAFERTDVRIDLELDISERVQRDLGLGLSPCRVLLIDSPYLLLEALTLNRSSAVLLPLHLVVCGRGTETVIHRLNPAPLQDLGLPAIRGLEMGVAHALELAGAAPVLNAALVLAG